jgi:hypothetical protein
MLSTLFMLMLSYILPLYEDLFSQINKTNTNSFSYILLFFERTLFSSHQYNKDVSGQTSSAYYIM